MEIIYIRPLELCQEAIFTYVCILVAELLCIFLIRRISHTSVKYASSVLATDGYCINSKGIQAYNEHYVKRPCYILPVVLYVFLLLISIISVVIPIEYITYDILQYLYIHLLVCSTVAGQLTQSIGHAKRGGIHFERLLLADICNVLKTPTSFVLVFYDRRGWIYEYITDDPMAWKLGEYFDATCNGETITEIDTTPQPQKFFGYQVLCTHLMCSYYVTPILLLIVGILLCFVDLVTGILPILISFYFIPHKHKNKLYVLGLRYTTEYKDFSYNYNYVFTLIDRKNNVYYFPTDDKKALDIGVCYDCVTRSGKVLYVLQSSEIQKTYWHKRPQSVYALSVLYVYMFIGVFVAHFLNFHSIAYILETLAFVLIAQTIKYCKRGDV